MTQIQLHRMEGFYRVAKAGGYARAARAFPYPITQPAVHQQVRKLEGELGARLFDRVGKDRMVPTAAGRRLLTFCAPFFEQLPSVVRSIEAMGFGGELRIDGAGLAVRHFLPSWIKRLGRSRADIEVRLVEIELPNFQRLETGDADLIVDYLPEIPDWVATVPLAQCHFFAVLPREHEGAGDRLAWKKLRKETFISYDVALPHRAFQLSALARHKVHPPRSLFAGSVDTILSFVQAGLGFSLVPWLDEQGPKVKGVKAYRLKEGVPRITLDAAWRATQSPNPLVEHALSLTQ